MASEFHEDWFSYSSGRVLTRLARRTNHLDGRVVEVGCWEGKSTIALAHAVYPAVVEAVDTWRGSPGEISADLARTRDVFATFLENTRDLTRGNVTPHRMDWREFFSKPQDPIRFLHIDATHSRTEVRDNILAALPFMVPGGIIAGDDNHDPEVCAGVIDAVGRPTGYCATIWFREIE